MKTIRITRQGFPNVGQHSWMNYFKFILSKKYNVIIDPINPDIVIHSDLNYKRPILPCALSYKNGKNPKNCILTIMIFH